MKIVKERGGLKTAPMDIVDVASLQAVFEGQADEIQQRRAIRWILDMACGIHDISFDPENPHVTSFNEGRRFVGKQISEALRTDTARLKDAQ